MSIIHTHPLALQHLMPALMRFYVGQYRRMFFVTFTQFLSQDVENAGASGQFYKFCESRIYKRGFMCR